MLSDLICGFAVEADDLGDVVEGGMMRYRIVKDASLRESMRRYREKGDERWKLFDALVRSSTYDEYMAKVRGFEQEMTAKKTGNPWKVTPLNCFQYVLRNGRIALVQR